MIDFKRQLTSPKGTECKYMLKSHVSDHDTVLETRGLEEVGELQAKETCWALQRSGAAAAHFIKKAAEASEAGQ